MTRRDAFKQLLRMKPKGDQVVLLHCLDNDELKDILDIFARGTVTIKDFTPLYAFQITDTIKAIKESNIETDKLLLTFYYMKAEKENEIWKN